jgi:hypothetical protein
VKLWTTVDEWKLYAACGDSIDHTLPPERPEDEAGLPLADPPTVRRICSHCRVRPECIRWAIKPGPEQPVDVWVAGKYIPVNKRRAQKVRLQLAAMLDKEYAFRGEDI